MGKYGLHNKLTATSGKGKELSEILIQASQLMSTAKGCDLYIVSLDRDNNDIVWITEAWDSKEDHDDSLSIDGVRELIGQAMPMLAEPPQKGDEMDILGGHGI